VKSKQPAKASRDAALSLWVVLARAFDAVERHSRASIVRFGLGTTEFGVLEVLYHKGELPVCEVRRRILVESSSTTYVVDQSSSCVAWCNAAPAGTGPPGHSARAHAARAQS